jgi:FtsP/CotA-like multicopper oxidase with cupredoxin domain
MKNARYISRRRFLSCIPLLLPLQIGSGQQVESRNIIPQLSQTGIAQCGSADDPLALVFNRTVTTLKGVDPNRALRDFYWGTVSRSASGQTLRSYEISAEDVELEVAPGVIFHAWAYNGMVPGPTLRCRYGDRIQVHFLNRSISDHTLHFHGIHSAAMDGVTPLIRPNDEYIYEFEATPAGLHLYHCHVPPVSLHMSRGMFGAFIVEPERGLPPAQEMVMVLHAWDINFDTKNEIYAINGAANFFRDNPIPIERDSAVRIFLLNALEHDPVVSFHIHANFFRTMRLDGPDDDGQLHDIITLSQAERAIITFSYRFPGLFMFHPHQNSFAEKGAMGHFLVE